MPSLDFGPTVITLLSIKVISALPSLLVLIISPTFTVSPGFTVTAAAVPTLSTSTLPATFVSFPAAWAASALPINSEQWTVNRKKKIMSSE